ncbi:unnamed protein product [Closterium sp. Yama58-4]|nr:unnamed protein product [Closterium sp. Yama58-4]
MPRLDGGDWLLEEENQSGAQGDKRSRARRLVVDLVVRYPPSIYCIWELNLKHKVEYLKRDMGLSIMELFLWVAVSPAVAEELLFRGLLLTALQERLGSMALGIAAGLLAGANGLW